MVDEFAHEREDIRVVGGGREHDPAVAERVLDTLRHVLACEVSDDDLGTALHSQLVGEQLDSLLGVAVNGGVGDHDALGFHTVARPCVVEVEVVAEVLGQDGTVERADDLDIQTRRLFEQVLHLRAVLADDADVVASRLASPVLVDVESPEFAETVSGEEHLVLRVVGHHDLRPVNHRSRDEAESMGAKFEGVALFDDDSSVLKLGAEEVAHHRERLCGGYDRRVGIVVHEVENIRAVVRLHVLDDQVVGLFVTERFLEVVEPLMGEIAVNGVHDRDFPVDNHIGVVRHAVGNDILTLKQVNFMVVHADITDVVSNVFHFVTSLSGILFFGYTYFNIIACEIQDIFSFFGGNLKRKISCQAAQKPV